MGAKGEVGLLAKRLLATRWTSILVSQSNNAKVWRRFCGIGCRTWIWTIKMARRCWQSSERCRIKAEVLYTNHFTSPLLQLCASFDSFHLVSHYQSGRILSRPSIRAADAIIKDIVACDQPTRHPIYSNNYLRWIPQIKVLLRLHSQFHVFRDQSCPSLRTATHSASFRRSIAPIQKNCVLAKLYLSRANMIKVSCYYSI